MSDFFRPTMPEPRIVILNRYGPKHGQSTSAWLYGKDRNCQAERDAAKWQPIKKAPQGASEQL